jgi:adenosine deaminase
LRAGVPVTLSTDDLTVSAITLTDEYVRAVERLGLTLPELWSLDRAAVKHAFADATTRSRLLAAFDAWAAGEPRVHAGA